MFDKKRITDRRTNKQTKPLIELLIATENYLIGFAQKFKSKKGGILIIFRFTDLTMLKI